MLEQLLSTRERLKILRYVLNHPSKAHRVREVADALSVSVGSVSAYLAVLKKAGLLSRKANEFRVRVDAPLVRAAKILLNVDALEVGPAHRLPGCRGVGVYGSWGNGSNSETSDIDLWITVDAMPETETVAQASKKLKERMHREVHLLVLDPTRKDALIRDDPAFYSSLFYGSIVLHGRAIQD